MPPCHRQSRAYLLLLLLETGLKKAKLFLLQVDDVDRSDSYNPVLWIQYTGKKVAKSRRLRLPPTVRPVLAAYRTSYQLQQRLFPYTPGTLEAIVTTTTAQAGISKQVTDQILSDTGAVRLIKHGTPLETVLRKLGLNPSTWEDAKEKYVKLTAIR